MSPGATRCNWWRLNDIYSRMYNIRGVLHDYYTENTLFKQQECVQSMTYSTSDMSFHIPAIKIIEIICRYIDMMIQK